MILSNRDLLSILQIETNNEGVAFDTIAQLLSERPSNMIYCENDGRLCGIISMGDIKRAAKDGRAFVGINTSYTYLEGYEYMRAKRIFFENDRINSLPIVDGDHRLVGAYSRWDDAYVSYDYNCLRDNKYADSVWKKYKKVTIVSPAIPSYKKKQLVDAWRYFFKSIGVTAELVLHKDVVKSFDNSDMVFFVDEDEIRGLGTLYGDILCQDFRWNKATTFKNFSGLVDDIVGEGVADDVLNSVINSGVHLLTIDVTENEGKYWKELDDDLNSKFESLDKKRETVLYEEYWKDFYGELYSYDYAKEVALQQYPVHKGNFTTMLKDSKGKYYNATDGERLTVDQPLHYYKTIYFFGACLVVGIKVDDAHTMESELQRLLNENNILIKVVNYGSWQSELQLLQRVCSVDYKKGDIVILYDSNKRFKNIPSINLAECLERNNAPATWFVDWPNHGNHRATKMWANEIFSRIPEEWLGNNTSCQEIELQKPPIDAFVDAYIERFFHDVILDRKVGSIVMNCNPFTFGHRYLIEKAAEQVDFLIIFAVEEDESLFSFKERLAMIVEGTRDIKNILVVPSGNFILSQQTFPEYFIKVEDDSINENAESDIRLFAGSIAPKLNIKYRFVGEERKDTVTLAYNQAMKKILPDYGIELVEIPRKTTDDGVTEISATIVRDKIEKGQWENLEKLVPQSTIDIIRSSW